MPKVSLLIAGDCNFVTSQGDFQPKLFYDSINMPIEIIDIINFLLVYTKFSY